MLTFGTVEEEYIFVREAEELAIALLAAAGASPVTLAALSVEIAWAPESMVEVEVDRAVAGWLCAGMLLIDNVMFSFPPICPIE